MTGLLGGEIRTHDAARKVVVFPCCGLCNRIQVLVCAALLAADTSRELFVNWCPGLDCGAAFNDLFLQSYPALETLPEHCSVYSSVQKHPGVVPGSYARLLANNANGHFAKIRRDKSQTLAIFSCHQFLGYFHDPRFAPAVRQLFQQVRPEIMHVAESFRERSFGPTTVGVHIRRGDWRHQWSLDYYFGFMQQFPDATFFVSTDAPELFEAVQQRFPRSVRYAASSLERREAGAVRDALVDLLLLASTSYLIGTPGSSFSTLARIAGNLPGNADYGYSLSRRDLKLGNLDNISRVIWGRWRQRFQSRAKLVRPG